MRWQNHVGGGRRGRQEQFLHHQKVQLAAPVHQPIANRVSPQNVECLHRAAGRALIHGVSIQTRFRQCLVTGTKRGVNPHVPGPLSIVVRPNGDEAVVFLARVPVTIFQQQQICQQLGNRLGFVIGQPFGSIKRYQITGTTHRCGSGGNRVITLAVGFDLGLIDQLAQRCHSFAGNIAQSVFGIFVQPRAAHIERHNGGTAFGRLL